MKPFLLNTEKKYYSVIRFLSGLVLTLSLIVALGFIIYGFVLSNKNVNIKDDIKPIKFLAVKDIQFENQIQVVEEIDEETGEVKKDENIDIRILAIHTSISKHFQDERPNREQFADKERGVSAKGIKDFIDATANGEYTLGSLPRSFRVQIKENEVCKTDRFPPLDDDQKDELIDQLRDFWNDAEVGALDNQSEFIKIRRYDQRLGSIWAVNDLFLCNFANEVNNNKQINAEREALIEVERASGIALMLATIKILDIIVKFLAAAGLVLLTYFVYRISQKLR